MFYSTCKQRKKQRKERPPTGREEFLLQENQEREQQEILARQLPSMHFQQLPPMTSST
jgi:hypothetical protein